ncbi:MAG TPA: DUF4153 domain-containing protein [Longimicrobiales bacterium]|nr:DUF4153 domain-containing protein [Longimicrobiales bacterium]
MTAATLGARAGRYLHDAAAGIRRAPAEVLATLAVAVGFSWAVEVGDPAFSDWAELAVACLLLLVVAWTGTLLEAMGAWHARRRWAFTVGGGLVVAIYAYAVADFTYAAEAWRAALLVGAALFWLFALPAFGAVGAPARVDRMRRVDGRILLRIIGALLYGGALFAGLALALRAVDVLFELSLEDELYAHVFGWIFFALVPWIVLGGLPDYVRPVDESNAVAGIAQRIVAWLVPPLLALYYLILYAYVVRIVVTGEIPKNLVSPLVLVAGLLAALALLLFDPRPGGRGFARGLRLAPPLFLPLAVLGAWALLLRVAQYGLTEFRAVRLGVLAALAVLAVAATVQVARRRPFALHVAPIALAAVLLLSAIGPWSALALSRRSQQSLLETSLGEVGIAPADTTHRPPPPDTTAREVPAAAYQQIRGSAQYLAAHFGPAALPPVLRRVATREDARWLDYAAELGLRPDSLPEGERFAMGGSLPLNAPVDLIGGTAYRISWSQWPQGVRRAAVQRGAAGSGGGEPSILVLLADTTRLALRVDDGLLYADLAPLIASLARMNRRGPEPELPVEEATVSLVDSAGVARGQFLVWSLRMRSDSTGTWIGHLEALAILERD